MPETASQAADRTIAAVAAYDANAVWARIPVQERESQELTRDKVAALIAAFKELNGSWGKATSRPGDDSPEAGVLYRMVEFKANGISGSMGVEVRVKPGGPEVANLVGNMLACFASSAYRKATDSTPRLALYRAFTYGAPKLRALGFDGMATTAETGVKPWETHAAFQEGVLKKTGVSAEILAAAREGR